MKKRQLLVCLMSFLFIATQAQIYTGNNVSAEVAAFKFLTQSTASSKVITWKVSKVPISKTLNVTIAGTLNKLLTSAEKSAITNLTITGNIDTRDFRIMRDSMPNLSTLDMNAASIASYIGSDGTVYSSTAYPANEIPQNAFYISGEKAGSAISVLTSIILPSTVTSVGSMAFTFCKCHPINILR